MSGTAEKPQLLLKHHLKQLKLPTFLAEYEKQARECAQAGVDHTGYLLRLAELELPGGHRPPKPGFARLCRAGANGAWSSGVLSGRDQTSIAAYPGGQVPGGEKPRQLRLRRDPVAE